MGPMPRTENGEKYLNTSDVRIMFDKASKGRFYKNIQPRLRVYRFEGKRTPWYKESEVLALKEGKPLRQADITISGIFASWTKHLESLGYTANTVDTVIEAATLPEEVCKTFQLPAGQQMVRRERMSFVDRQPICIWSTYYPVALVGNVLDQMKDGSAHVVEHIKDSHKLTVGHTRDRYTARITTFEEQERFHLRNEEAVLILQRASYTKNKKQFVFFSDMVLLGDWFVIDHEQEVDIWDNQKTHI
jgi:hypothetical protein